MTENEQRERYENVPWLFYIFNAFNLWIVFLIAILIAGGHH